MTTFIFYYWFNNSTKSVPFESYIGDIGDNTIYGTITDWTYEEVDRG